MKEIVIKIPDEIYDSIINHYDTFPAQMKEYGLESIKNGIPLPKGHGDLKDVSKIDYQQGVFLSSEGEPLPIIHKMATIELIRDWLPTIIEADKEE